MADILRYDFQIEDALADHEHRLSAQSGRSYSLLSQKTPSGDFSRIAKLALYIHTRYLSAQAPQLCSFSDQP